MGNKSEQCSGDVLTSEVTWGQLSGSMKWARAQMCTGACGVEKKLPKGPEGLCAPESRLLEKV